MKKIGARLIAAVVFVLALASSLLDVAAMREAGDAEPMLLLRVLFVTAVMSALMVVGIVVCRGHERREKSACVGLAWLAYLSVMWFLAFDPEDGAELLPHFLQLVIVACYARSSYLAARVFTFLMGRSLGVALHLAIHAALVLFCTFGHSLGTLTIGTPNVAWMSLCWSLFALPVYCQDVAVKLGRPRMAAIVLSSF